MSVFTETSAPEERYEVTPKISPNGEIQGDLLEVAMGPQHPSTHGVFRMDVVLDGERDVHQRRRSLADAAHVHVP